jgi:N utilization substance protein A
METKTALPRPELLAVADAVAREKGINKDDVFEAMEVAIQKAGRSKYGFEHDIRASINRKDGSISLNRYRLVVEEIKKDEESDEDDDTYEARQILIEDAQDIEPDVKLGEYVIDQLPPIDFGRIAAQTAKQVITQRVREAERNRQFEEYKDKVGQVVNGVVKRIEFGNVILDIGKTEALLRRDEIIPREKFRNGDRVRAYILDVRQENRGPQIFLSRTCPEFMTKLFSSEVPEIYDNIVEIVSVSRDPGSKAKIAVKTNDNTIDPVGACVGLRGIRVQAVVNELQGEKIDIINWTEDKAQLVINALAPAEVSKVILDEEKRKIEVVLPEDQLSLAIGRRGQNVKLASQLVNSDIDVLTEAQEEERRTNETKVRSQKFIDTLDVDEIIAHLLIAEGFTNVDQIAYVETSDLVEIEGFDEDVATELQNRAKEFVKARNEEFETKKKELNIDQKLIDIDFLDQDMIIKLADNDIKNIDDLGDLASDELIEILGEGVLNNAEANKVIMDARKHWFAEEEK